MTHHRKLDMLDTVFLVYRSFWTSGLRPVTLTKKALCGYCGGKQWFILGTSQSGAHERQRQFALLISKGHAFNCSNGPMCNVNLVHLQTRC